jgi:hypothetical protein
MCPLSPSWSMVIMDLHTNLVALFPSFQEAPAKELILFQYKKAYQLERQGRRAKKSKLRSTIQETRENSTLHKRKQKITDNKAITNNKNANVRLFSRKTRAETK